MPPQRKSYLQTIKNSMDLVMWNGIEILLTSYFLLDVTYSLKNAVYVTLQHEEKRQSFGSPDS